MNTSDKTQIIPPLMPVNEPDHEPTGPGLKARISLAKEAVDRVVDRVGQPFTRPALAWKAAAGVRMAARTDENLKTLREANRVHRDAMRDLRRDRRAFEKARDEVEWWDILNGERRAARAVVRDSAQIARETKAVRREARNAYPMKLPSLAIRCHALHAVPTGAWVFFSESVASGLAAGTSVAAIACNLAAAYFASRITVADPAMAAMEALRPSQEERDLMQRLDPKAFQRYAEPRGLSDVVAAGATLTGSGIQVKLTLNGTMDLAMLQKREAALRAALRLREGTRMEIREGKTGGHARLTLRTRSNADGLDMTGWKPGDSWAVNTITGETVPVPLGKRILFAGTSGSGKSWAARPLMAEASEYADHRLVVFDRKYIEARNWEHRARTACELDDMRTLCEELTEEGEARLKLIPRGSDVVEISKDRPRITVFVDEGGELLSDSKTKHPKDEEGRSDYGDIVSALRTIARKYRAAEIILVWCTQKPALTGEGHGLDSQIAGQLVHRLSLALATATDTQVVFGSDAIEKGWKANELPMPGFALFRNQELGPKSIPQMMKMRAMSPAHVIALPERPVWSRTVSSSNVAVADNDLRKSIEAGGLKDHGPVTDPWAVKTVGDTITLPTAPDSGTGGIVAVDRDDQIMAVLRDQLCAMTQDVADTLGMPRRRVASALERLANDGLVTLDADGCWRPTD